MNRFGMTSKFRRELRRIALVTLELKQYRGTVQLRIDLVLLPYCPAISSSKEKLKLSKDRVGQMSCS